MKVTVNLTAREAEAVLRYGLSHPYGVRKSQAVQTAEMKIVGAVRSAQVDSQTTHPTEAIRAKKESA